MSSPDPNLWLLLLDLKPLLFLVNTVHLDLVGFFKTKEGELEGNVIFNDLLNNCNCNYKFKINNDLNYNYS
jgi:hypothetical protein